MRRLCTVVSGLSLLVAIVVFTGPAALAAPALSASPATDLVDGQTVTVTATGFPANSLAGIGQCVEGYLIDGCDLGSITNVSTDATGSFTTTVVVNAVLATPIGAIDCRTSVDQCVLGANTTYQVEGAAWTPIDFDPAGALRPAPTLTVDPPGLLADGQDVTLHGAGLPPGSFLFPLLCRSDALSQSECEAFRSGQPSIVAPDGTATASAVARATFVTNTYEVVDCRPAPGTCAFTFGPLPVTNRTAVAPLAFDPSAPLEPRPTLTVTPSTDLADRQTVSVSGTGFFPDAPVDLRQCVSGSTNACVSVGFAGADGAGTFTLEVRVEAQIWAYGPIEDCRTADCALIAYSYGPEPGIALAELAFDPSAPLAPPPQVTATPSTDLADGQVLQVQGTGFDFGDQYGPVPVPIPSVPGPWPQPALAAGETTVTALLCEGSDPSINRCGYRSVQGLVADADGVVSGVFQVDATFETYDGPIDCREPGMACELRVGQPGNPLRVGTAPLTFDPDAPLAPPPTLAVAPNVDLVDGQTLAVSGAGYPVNRPVFVVQCVASGQFAGVCADFGRITMIGADGILSFDAQVKATVPFLIGGIDCTATPGACEVVVRTLYDDDADLRMPLSFRTAAPPTEPPTEPPPDVEVSPQTTEAVRPAFTG